MITIDQALFIGCGLVAIWALIKAFRDDRQLEEAGAARNFRITIFLACIACSVEVLLIGLSFWLIRTHFLGLTLLWVSLLVALGVAFFVTYKTWSDTWDAGERDWERRRRARDLESDPRK